MSSSKKENDDDDDDDDDLYLQLQVLKNSNSTTILSYGHLFMCPALYDELNCILLIMNLHYLNITLTTQHL
jgi:hypothetical protein